MLLSPLGIHQDIPKEYKLETMSTQVDNTFIFTEQDLPGFKSKSRQKFDPATANMPKRLTKPKFDKPAGIEKKPWDKNKKFQPYYMKAIPSTFLHIRLVALANRLQKRLHW
jgi:transcription initiation factor TFIIF subunit beta